MISTTLTAEHRRVARLPFNYTATFIYSPEIGFDVVWEPNRPRIRSPRAQRPFFRAYEAERNAFITELATMIGSSVLVADSRAARSPAAP